MSNPRIVAAALNINGLTFSVPAPARHDTIMRRMSELRVSPANAYQGFLTDAGDFLSRHDALVVAQRAGQIKNGATISSVLTSEDLW